MLGWEPLPLYRQFSFNSLSPKTFVSLGNFKRDSTSGVIVLYRSTEHQQGDTSESLRSLRFRNFSLKGEVPPPPRVHIITPLLTHILVFLSDLNTSSYSSLLSLSSLRGHRHNLVEILLSELCLSWQNIVKNLRCKLLGRLLFRTVIVCVLVEITVLVWHTL